MKNNFSRTLLCSIEASLAAGQEIMKIYNRPFEIERKEDDSPVTAADKNAHKAIIGILKAAFPHIPVLIEEGKNIPFEVRKRWDLFWLVDPLDGTKDFIKKNGEFTVNIALMEKNRPVLGVVYIPCSDTVYLGIDKKGAFKIADAGSYVNGNGRIKKKISDLIRSESEILPLKRKNRQEYLVIVKSRSHSGEETESCINRLLRHFKNSKIIASGSATKLCILAEGSADVYPRLGPTMEWDTAAGHAILRCAGGDLLRTDTWTPLLYNKEDLKNPSFIAVGGSNERMKKTLKSICTEGDES